MSFKKISRICRESNCREQIKKIFQTVTGSSHDAKSVSSIPYEDPCILQIITGFVFIEHMLTFTSEGKLNISLRVLYQTFRALSLNGREITTDVSVTTELHI